MNWVWEYQKQEGEDPILHRGRATYGEGYYYDG